MQQSRDWKVQRMRTQRMRTLLVVYREIEDTLNRREGDLVGPNADIGDVLRLALRDLEGIIKRSPRGKRRGVVISNKDV